MPIDLKARLKALGPPPTSAGSLVLSVPLPAGTSISIALPAPEPVVDQWGRYLTSPPAGTLMHMIHLGSANQWTEDGSGPSKNMLAAGLLFSTKKALARELLRQQLIQELRVYAAAHNPPGWIPDFSGADYSRIQYCIEYDYEDREWRSDGSAIFYRPDQVWFASEADCDAAIAEFGYNRLKLLLPPAPSEITYRRLPNELRFD